MKRIYTLILACFVVSGSLFGEADPPVDSTSFTLPTHTPSSVVSLLPRGGGAGEAARIALLLQPGMTVEVDGSELRIEELQDAWTGTGTLYVPALGERFAVAFDGLQVNAFGELLRGELRARQQVQSEGQGARYSGATTLPLNITSHLRSRLNYALPQGSVMDLTDLAVTDAGTFIALNFATPTLVEDDVLSFTGQRLKVDVETFCLDDANLDIVDGGGFIDDFEFPMRILAGDPDEEDAGSYVTFDCDGFKEFNLSAQYPFPRAQVIPAANSRDTVFANFRIKATGLGDFVAFATVTPFEIAGVEDMVYTIDSAYVDYSDAENPIGFDWDPVAGAEPDMGWKGLFLRRLQVTLPESVGAFNGGEELTVGGENIIYSRGNGMSGDLYAYNLLDLSEGALDGWGFSIDTLETLLVQNSIGDFNFRGDVFIPVFGEGDEIAYEAFLGEDENGSASLTLALEVAGTYTVPFLGDVEMTLTEDSKAGVRFGNSGPEPYLSASGKIDISLGGEVAGVTIPEVNLPGITFQNFKLNDAEMAATQAANVATAGMDRMSFGTFEWGSLNLGAAMDAVNGAMDAAATAQNPTSALTGQSAQKKVNGKPVSIEDISFTTVEVGGEELKRLKVQLILNLTKGSGGLSGDLELGVRGKVDYGKLISLTPWNALSYHSLEVGDVEIEGRFGNVEFAGALSIYDQDELYGKGFKGGLMVAMKLGPTRREFAAMGQFGTAPDGYDYFFVDFRAKFTPGITMGALELTGLGGGLYYNLTKQASTQAPAYGERNPPVNNTPGQSFSGTTYTPRSGSIGLAAACSVGLAKKHDVFTSDAELTIEFGEESGIRKILFDLDGYFFLKDPNKKNEASLKANIAMELNFERGFLSADFAYEIKAPYNNPILVGGDLSGAPQGALLIDIAPNDENNYSNYFYFGKPRRPADVALKIGSLRLGVDAYFMIGSNLPDPVPLREIHPAFAGFPDISRSQGNSIGFAFGVQLASSGDVSAGPLSLTWDIVAGVDASIRKYSGVTCANTGREIGMSGWYIKGRAYTHIHAGVKLKIKINLGIKTIRKTVRLADLSVTASLVAELPNPTYIGGKVRVRGSALGFSVSKNMSIELGEKCISADLEDPSAVVASIKVIEDVYPEKDSEDAEGFGIFGEPISTFGFALNFDDRAPLSVDEMIVVPDEEDPDLKTYYYPYLKEAYINETGKGRVYTNLKWSGEGQIVKLVTEEVLKENSAHTFVVRVRWRIKEPGSGWRDLKDRHGAYVDEVKSVSFTTGDFPNVMAAEMLEPDRHFPGNGQRNWHPGFGPGEIYFTRTGMDKLFEEEYTREIEGYEPKTMLCDYAIRLTNLTTNETQRIPITERPGEVSLEELRTKQYSVQVATTNGNRQVRYEKQSLVSYNSKAIKYQGINNPDLYEKGKLYRFEILRVPRETEDDSESNVTFSEDIASAGSEGVVIRSASAQIGPQEDDPYKIPDIIYSFVYRVSKYDNLAQKVEQMRLANTGYGKKGKQEIDHPRQVHRGTNDIYADEVIERSKKVKDKYYLFRVDEGFDWWDLQRLSVNLRVEEDESSNYYSTTAGQKLKEIGYLAAQKNGTGYMWEAALEYDHANSHDGVWYEMIVPRTRGGEQSPRLTSGEIESGTVEDLYLSTGSTKDDDYSYDGKWDVGIRYKAKRVIKMQTDAAWILGNWFSQVDGVLYPEMRNKGVTYLVKRTSGFTSRIGMHLNPLGGPNAPHRAVAHYYPTGSIEVGRSLRLGSFSFYVRPYTWSNSHIWNFSIPSEEDVSKIVSAYEDFEPRPVPFSGYAPALRFYHQPFYEQLYEKVTSTSSVETTLPNALE